MIGTTDGAVSRVKWSAVKNDKSSFNVYDLQVSIDFQHTKGISCFDNVLSFKYLEKLYEYSYSPLQVILA